MLELTRPHTVPGYRLTVNSRNFVSEVIRGDLVADAVHKFLLGVVAGPLVDRMATPTASQWPALVGALNDLSSAHHLQAHFNNATLQ